MRVSDYIRLNLLAAIWGASFIFMRISAPALGAVNTAFFRVVVGMIGLAVILFMLKKAFVFENKFKSLLVLGAINSGLPFLMYCLAATLLPAGYSAILNATTPLMGALIGFTVFGEKLPLRKWAGVVLGLTGITLITAVGEADSTGDTALGIVACLVATSCYGMAGFLTRRWISARGGLDSKQVALGSQAGAALFLLPFFGWSMATGPAIDWLQAEAWISVLALGILCTSLAYILYFRLIADIGPLRSLTVTFLTPPFAVLWGYLVLGETITSGFVIGALIVCVAVWMVVGAEKANASANA